MREHCTMEVGLVGVIMEVCESVATLHDVVWL